MSDVIGIANAKKRKYLQYIGNRLLNRKVPATSNIVARENRVLNNIYVL